MTLNEAKANLGQRPVFGDSKWLEAKTLLELAPLAEENFRFALDLIEEIKEAAALDIELGGEVHKEALLKELSTEFGMELDDLRDLVSIPPGLADLRRLRALAEAFEEENDDDL